MNENEQSCGVIPRVSNQYPSSPPSSSSPVFPPTFSPLDSFLCSYNFPILLSSVETEELTCVWQREIYTRRQEVLSLSGPFFPLSLCLSLFRVENEQHSLLYSHSKESITVTTTTEKSHMDSVSALLALTRAETKCTCGDWDEVMSKQQEEVNQEGWISQTRPISSPQKGFKFEALTIDFHVHLNSVLCCDMKECAETFFPVPCLLFRLYLRSWFLTAALVSVVSTCLPFSLSTSV